VSKVKELLKSKGHKVSSSRSTSTPVKQLESVQEMDYTQDDSLIEHSDMQFVIMEDGADLSNSGITHSEVAALNGSREHYEDDEITVVRIFFLKRFTEFENWVFLQKDEMVEDYQLDSSSISQYLQNRSEMWNPLSIDCPSVLGPSMVKVMASVESPPQTKTFTVLGPASTAPVHSESAVSSGNQKYAMLITDILKSFPPDIFLSLGINRSL